LSSYLAGVSLNYISAQLLTIFSGLLAGSSGLIWFWRESKAEESWRDTREEESFS
jgi:hypothetical protein